jgi:hypothetical protein
VFCYVLLSGFCFVAVWLAICFYQKKIAGDFILTDLAEVTLLLLLSISYLLFFPIQFAVI